MKFTPEQIKTLQKYERKMKLVEEIQICVHIIKLQTAIARTTNNLTVLLIAFQEATTAYVQCHQLLEKLENETSNSKTTTST